MKTTLSFVLALAVLIVCAVSASAATLGPLQGSEGFVYSLDAESTLTNSESSTINDDLSPSFPQFNPALGTLTSVTLSFSSTVFAEATTIENNSSCPSSGNATIVLGISVEDGDTNIPPNDSEIDLTSYTTNYSLEAGGAALFLSFEDQHVSGNSVSYTTPVILSEFTGSGSISLSASAIIQTVFTNVGGNPDFDTSVQGTLSGTVTYSYTPLLPIPTVTWTNPAAITYGTALSSDQLNATASVDGSFVYTPSNGIVLNAGTNILSVVFTPTDTVNYGIATNSVSLVVTPEALTVTAANASRRLGTANPVFTGTVVGVTNGDNISASYSTPATSNSAAGTYPITPSLVDPNNRRSNYTVTLVNGTLTVTRSSTYATPYTFITLAGKPEVAGTNDGMGSSARFGGPTGVAVDNAGTLRTKSTTRFDRSHRQESSRHWPGSRASTARTTGWGRPRSFITLPAWLWITRPTCMSRTLTTRPSER